jgi:uncharacterized protein
MAHRNAASFVSHEIETHSIEGQGVEETFTVKVLQPMSRADGSERFPVLYTTDTDYFFGGLANLATLMQGYGEVPRFILVGIGYRNAAAAAVLRMRDLFSRPVQKILATYISQVAESEFVSGLSDVRVVTETTDAVDFLHFLRAELMPFVASHYPTIPDDNSYWGYSAGATFGLQTLFTEPETFKRYILGSPGVSYKGHHFGIELAGSFVKAGRPMNTQVFLSVGELEELHTASENFDLVTGYIRLVKFLQQAAIPGLSLATRIFPDESHATAWTAAFTHGLKAVFGSAAGVPFWPDSLK